MSTTISKYHLSLQHVTKGFVIEGVVRTVLSGVNYQFISGVSYAIVGPSGSGKSTMLHVLAGFDEVDSGVVAWGGQPITALSSGQRDALVAQHIGFVFQTHYLIAELSVRDNVRVASLLATTIVHPSAIDELLAALGMIEYADHYPHQLSGGQQQRASLARALIRRPTFLIADEITGSLDAQTGAAIIDICLNYQKNYGMGIIIATHDPLVYEKMDVVVKLNNGCIQP